ncbi:MAG: hypothetical protein KDA85_06190, partial [Planctomycetaceae bacterium]|nr:hypothetical protein [Planctomycetaceae bacterium]
NIWKLAEASPQVPLCEDWTFRYFRARPNDQETLACPGVIHEIAVQPGIAIDDLTVVRIPSGKAAGPRIQCRGILDSSICSDSQFLVIAATDCTAKIFDIGSGQQTAASPRLSAEPRSICTRPGQPQFAVLCSDGKISVHEQFTGALLREFQLPGEFDAFHRAARVVYAPSGRQLLIVGSDGSVTVLDAETGTAPFEPIRPVIADGICRDIAISADSRWLATAVNGRNAVQVWDLKTGAAACQPLPHPGDYYGIFAVAFSPDGTLVASGNKDGRARVWDWKREQLACPPLQHSDEVLDVDFTPDGRHVITAVRNQRPQLWDVSAGKQFPFLQRFPLPPGTSTDCVTLIGEAAVCGAPNYPILDLTQLFAEPTRDLNDTRLIAELVTGREVQLGELSLFSRDVWKDRWTLLALSEAGQNLIGERMAAELLQTPDHMMRLQIARAAAERKQLDFLLEQLPDVIELYLIKAELLESTGDLTQAQTLRTSAHKLLDRLLTDNDPNHTELQNVLPLLGAISFEEWHVLAPESLSAQSGITLSPQANGAVIAGDGYVDTDSYVLEAISPLPQLTAIQLETLPLASLPSSGPGWANGNFHLTQFAARIRYTDGTEAPLEFRCATSDYHRKPGDRGSRAEDGPNAAIDSSQSSRWDVSPLFGQPHQLVMELAEPVQLADGDRVIVRLDFQDPIWKNHRLGHFRLSVTAAEHPGTRFRLRLAMQRSELTGDSALTAYRIMQSDAENAVQQLQSPQTPRT